MTSREERLERALRGILEIGKRDMSNPKYDGYFNEAREALAAPDEPPAPAPQPAEVAHATEWLRAAQNDLRKTDTAFSNALVKNMETVLTALESQQAQVKAADALIEECIQAIMNCGGEPLGRIACKNILEPLKGKSALAPKVLTARQVASAIYANKLLPDAPSGLDMEGTAKDLNAALRQEPSR